MEKIKRVLNENRVLIVLGIILILCLVIVSVVALTYFYGSSDTVYGNRLEDAEKLPLNDKLFKDIESKLKENDSVKKVSINLKGKIVYIDIEFELATEMESAKGIAASVLPLFNDDELAIYDISFTISSLSTKDVLGYTLMGARNANGFGEIVWNNYNISNGEDEEVE